MIYLDYVKEINACVPEWSKGLVSKTSSLHPGFESQAQVPVFIYKIKVDAYLVILV